MQIESEGVRWIRNNNNKRRWPRSAVLKGLSAAPTWVSWLCGDFLLFFYFISCEAPPEYPLTIYDYRYHFHECRLSKVNLGKSFCWPDLLYWAISGALFLQNLFEDGDVSVRLTCTP